MKKRHKLVIDPRYEGRELDSKLRIEQFGGGRVDGGFDMPDNEQLDEVMEAGGWSDDPGTGRAVLMPDGRELVNPATIAPPVSVSVGESVNELVERALSRHYAALKAADEIDTVEDANDFDDDEDFFPSSMYEIVLRDEAPAIPAVTTESSTVEEVVQVEKDLPSVDPLKKKPKPKAPVSDLDEEGA